MFTNYIKLALKVMVRRKFFTFISLFGISMTLVVLMVATAILDNVYTARAPESRFSRVLCVFHLMQKGEGNTMTTAPGYGFLDRYVRTLPGIELASIYSAARATRIYLDETAVNAHVKQTDGAYWKICDFTFLEGRPYTQAEDDSGARVAVITDRLAAKLFGGTSALGKTVELEGDNFRVVGVVPFVSNTRMAAYSEVWVPIGTNRSSTYRTEFSGSFQGLVLARSAADIPRLKREFLTLMKRTPSEDPKTFTHVYASLDTLFEATARGMFGGTKIRDRAPLVLAAILAGAALLFMTLPALNLVTLNLSRILERASEIGVRKAFGAPRRALVMQFVFENVVITIIGGVVGFALAAAAIYALNNVSFWPDTRFDLNVRVFAYGMLLAAFFGVLSGLYPAWRMSRMNPVSALRGGVH
jgi:putative ABC transport system permease protein